MMGGESREERFAEAFGRLAPALLIISLLLTVVTASVLVPLPEFTTDLSAFAPENEAKSAEERMNLVMKILQIEFMFMLHLMKKALMY